jgi:RHS repeat-associated protein
LECAIDNQSSGNYLYDVNGSLKKDVQGQIDTIKYDYRGLPLEIKKAGTSTYYRYNAEGQRVFKQTGTGVSTYYIADASGKTLAVVKSSTGNPVFNLWGNDHIGQLVVSYGAGGNGIVQGLETPLVTQPRSDTRYYFLKDHLGSVRVTVDVSGNVTSYDDFYPFGMTMDGRSGNIGSGDARYKYTTKERDAESGYDYFGARYYDARIGRFLSVDSHTGRYVTWSPYTYALDNPLKYVDPNGKDAIPIVFKDYKISAFGVKWSGLGHAGILLIENKTGVTKYYEYGRYDKEGKGIVRQITVSDVVLDKKTGMPTTESLTKVLGQISKATGQGGDITGTYVKNDNFKEMNTYAQDQKAENANPNREKYSLTGNNCGTFVKETLEVYVVKEFRTDLGLS